MQPRVSIIILNYNGKQFNQDCLNSVLSQSYQDFEIIFVDNGSSDGSLEEVEYLFKNEIISGKIIIIKNKENTGFTGGNNIGVKNSNAIDYIWLLNNDIIADKDALKYLIEGIESDEKIGATGSLVLDKGNEEFFEDILVNKKSKLTSTFFGEVAIIKAPIEEINSGIYNAVSISGCSFLYRKNLIKFPFPEFYFAYGEDIWLSFFILLKGKKIIFDTRSIIHHFGGGAKKSQKKLTNLSIFHGNKNQIINYLVFYDSIIRLKLFPLFIITQVGHLIFNFSLIRIKIKLKSIIWILKNKKEILLLRKFIKKNKIINNEDFIKYFSSKIIDEELIYNPYLKKITILTNKISYIYCKITGLQ
ncbi:glycosyltransferase family 2 protein [Candidatus Gracilibacteria bacterium]|nr:glycosyltransferase family 2 protein [Candidatus Gracilibacteria bacterium]